MSVTTIVKTTDNLVHFNDGEDAVYGDFNDVGMFGRAALLDNGLGELARSTEQQYAGPNPRCFVMPGGGEIYLPAGVRSVSNQPGVLLMRDSYSGAPAIDGLTPRVRAVRLAVDDLLTDGTALVADPTNPRWAFISLRLDSQLADLQSRDFTDLGGVKSTQPLNKKSRILLSKSVDLGTPAASPTFPTIPDGFVPWAAVFIPAAYASAFTTSLVDDLRMPIGLRSVFVHPYQMYTIAGAATAASDMLSTTVNSTIIIAPCPVSSPRARLVGMHVFCDSGIALYGARKSFLTWPPGAISPLPGTGSPFVTTVQGWNDLDLSDYNTIDPVNNVGGPYWCDGGRMAGGVGGWVGAYLQTGALTGVRVWGVRFDIAGG